MIRIERQGKYIHKFELDNGQVSFEIELRGHLTVLEGDGSTGKTFFLKSIFETYPNNVNAFRNFGVADVLYINSLNMMSDRAYSGLLDKLKGQKGCLILIDNGDKVLNGRDKLLKYIAVDTWNQYIICSRGGVGLGVSPNHFAELKQHGNKITTEFYWNVRGWR